MKHLLILILVITYNFSYTITTSDDFKSSREGPIIDNSFEQYDDFWFDRNKDKFIKIQKDNFDLGVLFAKNLYKLNDESIIKINDELLNNKISNIYYITPNIKNKVNINFEIDTKNFYLKLMESGKYPLSIKIYDNCNRIGWFSSPLQNIENNTEISKQIEEYFNKYNIDNNSDINTKRYIVNKMSNIDDLKINKQLESGLLFFIINNN